MEDANGDDIACRRSASEKHAREATVSFVFTSLQLYKALHYKLVSRSKCWALIAILDADHKFQNI